jgi:hypothetical protein
MQAPRVAPETATNVRPLPPIGGGRGEFAVELSLSRPLPQSQRSDGENNRSRYRGRRPAPPDSYAEAGTAQELCRAFRPSSWATRANAAITALLLDPYRPDRTN